MATIPQIRGALLEEAILFLLDKAGYKTVEVSPSAVGLKHGHSGLEVEGRGAWHQIDALVTPTYSLPFTHPIRLMIEAKCYKKHKIDIKTVRNTIGVQKDISENYFTLKQSSKSTSHIQIPRYNYLSAIFSTSGFTRGAFNYALAHQVFLIQYKDVPIIQPLIDVIRELDEIHIVKSDIAKIRYLFRKKFRPYSNPASTDTDIRPDEYLTSKGVELIDSAVDKITQNIGGSYFGLLQGIWPLHLLTDEPLPKEAFTQDIIKCKITSIGSSKELWKFTPLDYKKGHRNYFEIEFSLPVEITQLIIKNWENPTAIANLKRNNFSFINLSGIIGGIHRSIRLELDENWLTNYLGHK